MALRGGPLGNPSGGVNIVNWGVSFSEMYSMNRIRCERSFIGGLAPYKSDNF